MSKILYALNFATYSAFRCLNTWQYWVLIINYETLFKLILLFFKNTANDVLQDAVHRLYQTIIYFKSITQLHGMCVK